jgi:hypothetical protein
MNKVSKEELEKMVASVHECADDHLAKNQEAVDHELGLLFMSIIGLLAMIVGLFIIFFD